MRAFARVDPEQALPTEHLSADGTIAVVGPSVWPDGDDYGQAILGAVQALMDQDPRIAQGHFFSIAIIA